MRKNTHLSDEPLFHEYWFHNGFVRPLGQIEQGRGSAARTRPIYAAQGAEIRLTKLE